MYTYKIKIKKVSGSLNESVLPSKNLLIKSKKSLSEKDILKEANAYFKKRYGLTVESLDVRDNDEFDVLYTTIYKNLKSDNPEADFNSIRPVTDMLMLIMKNCLSDANNMKKVDYHRIVKEHFLHGSGDNFRPYCELFATYKEEYGVNIDKANSWDFKHLNISEELKSICFFMFDVYIDVFNKRVNECIRYFDKYGFYPSDSRFHQN